MPVKTRVSSLPDVPTASKKTITMSGILVDVYGLEERSPDATKYTIIWLHHARTRTKEIMTDFANRMIATWTAQPEAKDRAVLCLAFDQRNHGTRKVDNRANGAWKDGNETHVQDLQSGIVGMVSDTVSLMDVVEGYMFPVEEAEKGKRVDQHLILGKSLGGHTSWQALFRDSRITGGIVIVGCPDFMRLLSNRSKNEGRPTWKSEDNGSSFLGSVDFPSDIVRTCLKFDPKGILFGKNEIPTNLSALNPLEGRRIATILQERLAGKKIFVTFGENDKVVPYDMSKPFLDFLDAAKGGCAKESNITLKQKVYANTGHNFSDEMVADSLVFLTDLMKEGPYGDEKQPLWH